MDIPVFHDDQHGTAIVTLAALQNALRIVDKSMADLRVVVAGVGAAGVAVSKILMNAGVCNVVGCDRLGAVHTSRDGMNSSKQWFAENTNPEGLTGSIARGHAGRGCVHRTVGTGPDQRGDVRCHGGRHRSCSPWPTPIRRSDPS